MLWYIVKEPSMTHAPSMAGAAAFIWMWAATRENRTLRQWALLGALAGFIGLIRWQNVLFALLPMCDALALLASAYRRKDNQALRATLIAGVAFTACAIVGFLPQMLAWRAIYGTFLAVSPVGPQIRLWDPQLVDILWSSRNGLLSWSPALYLGAIGLFIFAWMRPPVGLAVLLCLGVMVYFNASIQDWWGSAGFGGRRFDGTIPLFALGAAALGERAIRWTSRRPGTVVLAACALLALWNVSLMKVAQDGQVRIGEAGVLRRGWRISGAGGPRLVRQSVHVSREPHFRSAQRTADRFVRFARRQPLSRGSHAPLRTRGHRQRR